MNVRHLVLAAALAATLVATWWANRDGEVESDVVRTPEDRRPIASTPREAPSSGSKAGATAPAEVRAADRYAILGSVRDPWPDVGEELARPVNFSPPPASASAAPPPAPTAPPLPYRFVGAIEDEQGKAVFLLDGNQVRLVREGEKLGSQYRVERITPAGIEFTYLPLGMKQTLSRQSP